MPKKVDHEQRRLLIAEAVWQIAAFRGLEEVTMRQVAVAAGVSTRLVQYYFGTRDSLLLGALALRNDADRRRIEMRIPTAASPVTILRETLIGMIPLDKEGRLSALVQIAYFVRALRDPALMAVFAVSLDHALEGLIVALLAEGQTQGLVRKGTLLEQEARSLIATATGLVPDVLTGLRSAAEAVALIEHNIGRLLVLG